MTLKILIAPSGFKESLEAQEVADCIEQGIRRVLPEAKIENWYRDLNPLTEMPVIP